MNYPDHGKIEIPAGRKKTSITQEEGRYLFDLIRGSKLNRTLEIGLAYGTSTVYIMSASSGEHISIEPFPQGYEGLGKKNVGAFGFAERLTVMEEPSHRALPRLLLADKTFDFIFIDGSHKFDDIFIDWYYADKIIDKNGYIVFHDAWSRTTSLVASFVKTNRMDYESVQTPHSGFFVFKKTGEDKRPWHFFREFYSWRGLVRNVIKKLMH